jgi:hypothetical protein
MSRNARKGKATMACSSNDSNRYKNKANKFGKQKVNRVSKENEFLTESAQFNSVIAGNDESNNESLDDELSEPELDENEQAPTFPFDLGM